MTRVLCSVNRHWAPSALVTQPSISSGVLARSLLVDNLREFARRRQAVSAQKLLGILTTPPPSRFRRPRRKERLGGLLKYYHREAA